MAPTVAQSKNAAGKASDCTMRLRGVSEFIRRAFRLVIESTSSLGPGALPFCDKVVTRERHGPFCTTRMVDSSIQFLTGGLNSIVVFHFRAGGWRKKTPLQDHFAKIKLIYENGPASSCLSQPKQAESNKTLGHGTCLKKPKLFLPLGWTRGKPPVHLRSHPPPASPPPPPTSPAPPTSPPNTPVTCPHLPPSPPAAPGACVGRPHSASPCTLRPSLSSRRRLSAPHCGSSTSMARELFLGSESVAVGRQMAAGGTLSEGPKTGPNLTKKKHAFIDLLTCVCIYLFIYLFIYLLLFFWGLFFFFVFGLGAANRAVIIVPWKPGRYLKPTAHQR